MNRRTRVAIPIALGALAALAVEIADPKGPWLVLVLLGAAIAVGELLELRPAGRAPLPLSYAFVIVLVRAGTASEVLVTAAAALAIAFVLRPEPTMWRRCYTTAVRVAAVIAALVTYTMIIERVAIADERWLVLLSLVAAGVAEIAASDLLTALSARHAAFATEGRTADLAIIASGTLMAISLNGIGEHAGMGLWGPTLFAIPLLAAWFAFEQVAAIRRTHDQTIAALSVVPELAGLVRTGHAERVAALSERLGAELGFEHEQIAVLRSAALLHHLGHLCLDADGERDTPVEPWEVATKGAEILRQTDELTPAAAILDGTDGSVASHILRVASAYDELSEGDPSKRDAAIEALHLGPGYVYDVRVLAALERA